MSKWVCNLRAPKYFIISLIRPCRHHISKHHDPFAKIRAFFLAGDNRQRHFMVVTKSFRCLNIEKFESGIACCFNSLFRCNISPLPFFLLIFSTNQFYPIIGGFKIFIRPNKRETPIPKRRSSICQNSSFEPFCYYRCSPSEIIDIRIGRRKNISCLIKQSDYIINTIVKMTASRKLTSRRIHTHQMIHNRNWTKKLHQTEMIIGL